MYQKQYQNKFKNPRQLKGRFGESLCVTLLSKDLKIKYRNLRSPYGELDLIFAKAERLYAFEVKFMGLERIGKRVWSRQQKYRFYKSCRWLEKKSNKPVLGVLALVYKDSFRLLDLQESFYL